MDKFEDLIKGFNQTMDAWKLQLKQYSHKDICTQPDAESWSLGQVVLHLVEETSWYLEQINKCLKSDENAEKGTSPEIEKWFKQNSFPDMRFKGPPDLPTPLQPQSKEALLGQFDDLKDRINVVGKAISSSGTKGRAELPEHGFLNAKEWFQYAEMHMRHHFRQKAMIDVFLLRRG